MNFERTTALILASPILRAAVFSSWSILSGLTIGYALPPKLFAGIEWIGLVPFFLLLLFPMKSWRERFFYGWVSGSAAMGLYTTWFFDSFPLTWLQLDNFWAGVSLTFIAWFTVGVIVPGAAGGMFLVLAKVLSRNNFMDVFRIALLVAAIDYIRTFYLAGHPFTLGTGSLFGDNWAVNVFAYSIADYPLLLQLASVGGLYFLSFIAALPSSLLFFWVKIFLVSDLAEKQNRLQEAVLAGATVFVVLGSAAVTGYLLRDAFYKPNRDIRVAVISSLFTPEDWTARKTFLSSSAEVFSQLVKEAVSQEPPADVILLPEGSALSKTSPADPISFGKKLKDIITDEHYRIVINLLPQDNLPYGASRPTTNNISVFDTTGAVIGVYPKQFLMPFGEYMPYIFDWLWRLTGQTRWLDQHASNWRIPGQNNGVFTTAVGTLGVLGCSEIISPYISRRTVRDGAEILLYTASISILRNSERLRYQNLAIAQIRAAETRRYVAYAANGGHSFFISPDGTVLWENPSIGPGVKIVEAGLNKVFTPAVYFSNWFTIAAIFILALDFVFRRRNLQT